MKQFMKYSLLLLLCSAVFAPRVHAVTAVVPNTGGSAAANTTFQSAAIASAFYKPTKTMFFGLTGNSTTGHPSTDALGYVTDAATTYTGIAWTGAADIAALEGPSGTNAMYDTSADNAVIQNSNITAVAVVGNPATDRTLVDLNEVRIVFLSSQANTAALPVGVHCMTTTLGIPVYRSLTDADSPTVTVNTFTVVAGNSGTQMCAFAAVKDKDGTDADRGVFGTMAGDGVVSLAIDTDSNAMTQKSQYGSSSTVVTTSLTYGATAGTAQVNGPAMCYDETLKRLYVGTQYTTANTNADGTAGGLSVQIYDVSTDGELASLYSCGVTADADYDGGTATVNGNNIIGARGTSQDLAALKLRVMHTSTGPATATKFAYLIVNGGNGAKAAVANRVWAVPLVVGVTDAAITADVTDQTNVAAINGTFANVTTGDYSTRASAAGDLFTTSTAAARVGNGPLPCPAGTEPSDMWVDGDAVYCSIDAAAGSDTSPGVWHSQACFNRHGQIDHWTEWQRVSPLYLGGLASSEGRISHFAVDASSTKIWGVDTAKTSLRLTEWASDSTDGTAANPVADPKGLIVNLHSSDHLTDNCMSVCDLNSSTTGWGATTPMRITMFGNNKGKVSFAVTGSAVGYGQKMDVVTARTLVQTNTGLVNHVVFDYRSTGTLKTTTVLDGAYIHCLAYSGWDEKEDSLNTGYFFAGVEDPDNSANNGLYVWTKPNLGAGFDTRDVQDLTNDPFRHNIGDAANYRSWQKMTGLTGIPHKIVARGGAVYILTRGAGGNTDKIHRLTRQSTATLLDADFCVVAAAGATPTTGETLPAQIYDFVVTATALDTTISGAQAVTGTVYGEQLMMATLDGLYTTTCSVGTDDYIVGKDTDNSQLICGWTQLNHPETNGSWQQHLSEAAYTRDPSTFWFERSVQDVEKENYLARDFYQLSRWPLSAKRAGGTDGTNDGGTEGNWAYNPSIFNAYDGTTTEPVTFDQAPFVCNAYSDGSRRIKTISRDGYTLSSQPYETAAQWWNVTNKNGVTLYGAYSNWTTNVGSSGKILAGTRTGVIGLV